jgi:hypothetical protein
MMMNMPMWIKIIFKKKNVVIIIYHKETKRRNKMNTLKIITLILSIMFIIWASINISGNIFKVVTLHNLRKKGVNVDKVTVKYDSYIPVFICIALWLIFIFAF